MKTKIPPSSTSKPAKEQEFAVRLFVFYSLSKNPAPQSLQCTKVQAFATLG